MLIALDTLDAALDGVGAVVVDQYGVLHDGSAPYSLAVETLQRLRARGTRIAVLSNSGKRAQPNADRIAAIGFPPDLFECTMTSGEALWRDMRSGRLAFPALYPITRAMHDAKSWAEGLDVVFSGIDSADAVLLMGLPDNAQAEDCRGILERARMRDIPVLCSNPDRAAPRADGRCVISPGALAHAHAEAGGRVIFYGKPHLPVYRAVEVALNLPPEKLLMVGDSLEHDIAGARAAGWRSVFVRGGLHAGAFGADGIESTIAALARSMRAPIPDYTLEHLR
ncbi:TIGR01459 family HAD-type hydrolase [Tropicimonas sp.]|uniref:TIGR01459 family HAD-type hydrolase n=1 Tax=Tropicimonas sp. TaxID=2067044 RepID=UPI003A879BC9